MAQTSDAAFDAATFEIWAALARGARLVFFSRQEMLSPGDFARRLREQKVTVLHLTTAVFSQLIRSDPGTLRGPRDILFGSQKVDPRWVRRLLAQAPPERLSHMYGPTESTTFASWYPVERVAREAASLPVGRPIANTSLYLLDRHLRAQPSAVTGEIAIGGAGLARGYHGRPRSTAEVFVPHPSGAVPGMRVYRTETWRATARTGPSSSWDARTTK